MSESSTPAPFAPAPVSKPTSSNDKFICHGPIWVTVVRGFQALMSFIILVLSGLLIHGLVLPELVFALVCGLFSIMAITYALVTEKVASCRGAYNIWIVLFADGLLALFWFASCIANGVLRGTFVYRIPQAACVDNGNAVNAMHCVTKRAAAATPDALEQLSAVAGLSALAWLLFIATTVYNGHMFRMHNQAKAKTTAAVDAEREVEGKGQADPMLPDENGPQYQQQSHQYQPYEQYNNQEYAQYEQYPQYSEQNQYSSQAYAPAQSQAGPDHVQQPAQTHQHGTTQQ